MVYGCDTARSAVAPWLASPLQRLPNLRSRTVRCNCRTLRPYQPFKSGSVQPAPTNGGYHQTGALEGTLGTIRRAWALNPPARFRISCCRTEFLEPVTNDPGQTHVVARRNARGGRSAQEHLVAALRLADPSGRGGHYVDRPPTAASLPTARTAPTASPWSEDGLRRRSAPGLCTRPGRSAPSVRHNNSPGAPSAGTSPPRTPSLARTSSNALVNLASRSRMRNRNELIS
jgi:hypothetical protein